MEKLFLLVIIGVLALVLAGCKNKSNNDKTRALAALVVENLISMDRQDMYMHVSDEYTWYETCITLKNFMDGEDASNEIESVTNIFQVVKEHGESADVTVWVYEHTPGNTSATEYSGIWVGDHSLNTEEIKLTFEDAYNRLQEADCIKPHSRQCVLRNKIGPASETSNTTQYIFGNTKNQVYVDAVTGDVKN